jgi:hypothetical protein
MLLVVALTGAEPTLDGGGEFALDIEVDVIEALSDIISLVGVPGRSCLDIDARLGCRDGGNCGGKADVTELGVALPAAGVSGFMEEAIRNVFGAFVDIGDWIEDADGVLGGNGGNAVEVDASFAGTSEGVLAVAFGTDIFRMPGRLSFLDGVWTAAEVIADDFLLAAVDDGFTLEGVGVAGAFAFGLSSAGKSSD